MAERYSCASASREAQEPRYGTASTVRRWLLVEQPGTWGRDAPLESALPVPLARALRHRAREAGARLLLIRRFGRYDPEHRTAFAVTSTPRHPRVERFVVDDPTDLLDVDWSPLRSMEPVGGEVVDDGLFLVCTNGRHDACCAEYGRPLARALSNAHADRVWESSHFGGDRFAGNLVCLPRGLYYGHVEPDDGLRLAAMHDDGLIDLDHYRGHSWLPFPAQAAEFFVRSEHALFRFDDLAFEQSHELAPGRHVVTFAGGGARYAATVEAAPSPDPQLLTCKAAEPDNPPRYRLAGMDVTDGAPAA